MKEGYNHFFYYFILFFLFYYFFLHLFQQYLSKLHKCCPWKQKSHKKNENLSLGSFETIYLIAM